MPNKIEYDEFLSKAKKVWGDRFTYKKPNDFNYRYGKVQIHCSKEGHGWFERAAYYHVGAPKTHKPVGCPACLSEAQRNAQAKPFDKFGLLTAIKFLRRERSQNIWEFKCDCGNTHTASMATVKSGDSRSCGCLSIKTKKAKAIDLTGQRFTRLKVIRRVERPPEQRQSGAYWECLCDCGTKKVIRGSLLRGKNNPIRSCGCLIVDTAKARAFDLVGEKFGRLTVKRKSHQIKGHIYWYCECTCGGNITSNTNQLRRGRSKSCGCLKIEQLKNQGHNIKGQQFGSWTVIQKADSRNEITHWLCECVCGTQKDVNTQSLLMGTSQSCGCGANVGNENLDTADTHLFANLGEREKTVLLNKLKKQIRGSLRRGLSYKSAKKLGTTFELLNFTPEDLIAHLEKQFTKGMNWSNYGKWHIDHIVPLVNAKTPEDVIKLNNLKNLQPLWAEDNHTKNRY